MGQLDAFRLKMKSFVYFFTLCLTLQGQLQCATCQMTYEAQLSRLVSLQKEADNEILTWRAIGYRYNSLDITRKRFLHEASNKLATELRRVEEDNAKYRYVPNANNQIITHPSLLKFRFVDSNTGVHKKIDLSLMNDSTTSLNFHSKDSKRGGDQKRDLDVKKDNSTSLPGVGNVAQCYQDIQAALTYAAAVSPWAVQMVDATGRPGPGALAYRTKWPGFFEECLDVRAAYQLKEGKNRTFNGRYCNAQADILITGFPKVSADVWGLCLPDSCNSTEAFGVVKFLLQEFKISEVKLKSMDCHQPQEMPTKTIVVICLVGLLVFLVVLGTAFDLLVIEWPKWRRQEQIEKDSREHRTNLATSEENNDELCTLVVNTHDAEVTEYTPGVAMRLLLAFSAWTNAPKILNTHQPKDSLECLNGIRVISMFWVILGHSMSFFVSVTDNLVYASRDFVKRWSFQVVYNLSFCVDSFFVLSGLLVSFLTLTQMKRRDGKINWVMFYVHRYLRLTPVYMLCLAVYVTTMPYWTDGPFFPQRGHEKHFCEEKWWKNLLYIQVFFHKDFLCMGWTWYLAVDMIFYIVSPLILVPLYFKPRIGYVITALFFLMTTISPFVLTMVHHYGPGGGEVFGENIINWNRTFDIYFAPYCRMGPYLEGVLLGYLIFCTERRIRVHRAVNLLGWCVATALALTVV